jgi:hypothetical protein
VLGPFGGPHSFIMANFREEFRIAYVGGVQKSGRVLRWGQLVPTGFFTPAELDAHLASGIVERTVHEVADEREIKAFINDSPGQPEAPQKLETATVKPKAKRKPRKRK